MNMLAFQAVCGVVVLLWVTLRARSAEDPPAFLRRMAIFVLASWLGEETCIRAYDFYQYDPAWGLFVGHLPVMVPLIWPVVLHSAWDLARALAPRASAVKIGMLAGGLVFTDAAFIEPICVASGLWSWNAPGLFAVPPIGVLGWALFAAIAIAFLEGRRRQESRGLWDLGALILAPALTHGALLAFWWGALRWVSGPIDDRFGAMVALALGFAAAIAAWPLSLKVSRGALLMRVPAALVFGGLLVIHAAESLWLLAYAAAFALPYLVASARPRSGPGFDEPLTERVGPR